MCHEVQELEDYCSLKHADLDQEELHLSPDGSLKVLWWSIRSDDFHLVFTHVAVLYRIAQALKSSYDDDVPGFVLQTDWSGGVVWSQYHFGAVGLPLYHRDNDRDSADGARRWRRLCAPLAFCIGAWEDPPNISLMFVWCERLLRHLLTHNGLNHPEPLISQILGDWSLSLRKASAPVTSNLINDLEHITRRIERREDLPWSKAHVHRLLRMAAFCPHGAVVAVCWHYLLLEAPETFCKYMTENVMKHITPGRRAGQDFPVSDMWIPRFWSGSFSPARPGNSCSQQGAELMIKTIKWGKERKKQREKKGKKKEKNEETNRKRKEKKGNKRKEKKGKKRGKNRKKKEEKKGKKRKKHNTWVKLLRS